MRYPFLIYSRRIQHRPVFEGLQGDPFVADLSLSSPLLKGLDTRDQKQFQAVLDDQMGSVWDARSCNSTRPRRHQRVLEQR